MKKILALLIGILLVISQTQFVFADSFNVIVDSKEAKPGDMVEISVNFENNTGIIAALFELEYDAERIELKEVQDEQLLEGGTFSPDYKKHPYKMVWNSASAKNFTDNGPLVILRFMVLDNAKSGDAFIKLSYNPNDVFDADLNNVALNVINGGINVVGGIVDDAPDKNEDTDDSTDNTGSDSVDGSNESNIGGNVSSNTNTNSGSTSGNGGSASNTGSGSSGGSTGGNSGGGTGGTGGSVGSGNSAGGIPVGGNANAEKPNKNEMFILTIGKMEAWVFGEVKKNDVAPVLRNERTMLPARFVAENLGAEVDWNEATEEVTITKDDIKIVITIDSQVAYVNGKAIVLDSPAFLENDRTYTPLRFIAEKLGAKVDWVDETQEVIITMK